MEEYFKSHQSEDDTSGIASPESPDGFHSFRRISYVVPGDISNELFARQITDAYERKMTGLRYSTDRLYDYLKDEEGLVPLSRLIEGLKFSGIRKCDPRLSDAFKKFKELHNDHLTPASKLEKDCFLRGVAENASLITKAFTADLVIPEFTTFCSTINDIFNRCKSNDGGKVASYIPQLTRFNADNWGVAICTVDGQRHSTGDVHTHFSLQSCSKPLTYAVGLNELGHEYVHRYIGHEPSGQHFNCINLNSSNRPHNPMINSGAILMASLIKGNYTAADRFDFIHEQFEKMAGNNHIGYNNGVYLSERETADRNFAIGYLLKENNCFPENVNLAEVMDFYFQLCSMEVTCETASIMAATLANGGICPITDEQIVSPQAVRNTLSLMHSCGMYNYSGEFAFKVGLPSKSGVSGAVLLVVPNVMGICLWSPPLDDNGNSCRGIQFCNELVNTFSLHHYDTDKQHACKIDPRRTSLDRRTHDVMKLLYAAASGDVTYTLKTMALYGTDMGMSDYDGRTALHLASAEGHLSTVQFLLEKCDVPHNPLDRWNHSPLHDASRFKHVDVENYLRSYELLKKNEKNTENQINTTNNQSENLKIEQNITTKKVESKHVQEVTLKMSDIKFIEPKVIDSKIAKKDEIKSENKTKSSLTLDKKSQPKKSKEITNDQGDQLK